MKRYKLVESDVATIDPNLKALYEVVESLEANKPGSAERFAKILQGKYGITSTNSLKKSMSMWIKIPVGGLSLAGFITSMGLAIDAAAKSDLVNNIDKIIPGDKVYISIACVWLSFVFWKIFKYILGSSNKTESSNNSYSEQKAILESEIFINRIGQFIESDAGDAAVKLNATAEKADGICRRMFNWIKGKVSDGWGWIKKHPYITTAFLIVIGCVFYYISVLRGQVANLQGTVDELKSTNAEFSDRIRELSKRIRGLSNQLAQNVDKYKIRLYLDSEKDHVNKLLGRVSELRSFDPDGLNRTIYDDITKSASSMSKEQFAAYIKSLCNAYDSGNIDIKVAARLTLDKIENLVGYNTYQNLINATTGVVAFK